MVYILKSYMYWEVSHPTLRLVGGEVYMDIGDFGITSYFYGCVGGKVLLGPYWQYCDGVNFVCG